MSQVKDVIDGIKHRIPDRTNIYPALNRAVRLVNKRLFYHKSSWVRGALSIYVAPYLTDQHGSIITDVDGNYIEILASASSGILPSDYWGMMEKPYISTKTYPLEPVPDQTTKLEYTDASTPIYYEITGDAIDLYPGSARAITINGQYWTRPARLTKPTDTMPYQELLDDVIQEVLLREIKGDDIGAVQGFVYKAVDEIIPYVDKSGPKRIPDNAGWGGGLYE